MLNGNIYDLIHWVVTNFSVKLLPINLDFFNIASAKDLCKWRKENKYFKHGIFADMVLTLTFADEVTKLCLVDCEYCLHQVLHPSSWLNNYQITLFLVWLLCFVDLTYQLTKSARIIVTWRNSFDQLQSHNLSHHVLLCIDLILAMHAC